MTKTWEVRQNDAAPELVLADTPERMPGAGEIALRVRAIALNFRDLAIARGTYPGTSFPVVPFSDACGIVETVGQGVTRVAPGDRVATMFHQTWIDGPPTPQKLSGTLAQHFPGIGAERVVLAAEGVSRVPDFLSDAEAATLPCAALTAWRALFHDAHLIPGDTVVLEGTGGVSIFALQFARAAGLATIITSSSDEKLARATALGATHAINYRSTPEWGAEVRRLTEGRGADLIFDVGGEATIEQALGCVAMGGHIAVIGMLSGAPVANVRSLVRSNARLQGLLVGSRAMFEAMTRAVALHGIRPVVDRRFPFADAPEALAAMGRGEHFGKIVLELDG